MFNLDELPTEIREWCEDLPTDRYVVITERVARFIEGRVGTWDRDTDPILVATAFIDVIQSMYLDDILTGLVDNGDVRVSGIDHDGRYMYAAT